MNQQTAIGIDVGGTWTRAGIVLPNGRIVSSQRHPTPRDDNGQKLIDLLAQSIRNLESNKNPDSQATDTKPIQSTSNTPIGIALPGLLDQQRTSLFRSINLPFLQRKLIAKELHKAIGRTPVLITDSDAATWGEYIVRDPKPQRFVHLRLGTGIACSVIIDGQLITDEHSTSNKTEPRASARARDQALLVAQEVKSLEVNNRNQHLEVLIVDPKESALQCRCGRRGCLDTIASGFVLEQLAKENGFSNGLESLQDAWSSGDQHARSILIPVVKHISIALNNLMAQYQPDVITIGGGVVDYLPALLAMILSNHYSSRSPLQPSKPTRLEPARLGDHSGVVGAAMLAM